MGQNLLNHLITIGILYLAVLIISNHQKKLITITWLIFFFHDNLSFSSANDNSFNFSAHVRKAVALHCTLRIHIVLQDPRPYIYPDILDAVSLTPKTRKYLPRLLACQPLHCN